MIARITCSMMSRAMPWAWMRRMSPMMASISVGLRPDMTSSSSRSSGPVARPRAISSRLRSGSVSARAGVSRRAPSPTNSSSSPARARAAAGSSVRLKAPTITFSRAVRFTKGWTIWNVRARPRRQISCGRAPTTDTPLKRMAPAVGAWKPDSRWNTVVSPASTERLKPLTAVRPPNRLVRPSTSRSITTGRGPAAGSPSPSSRSAGTR